MKASGLLKIYSHPVLSIFRKVYLLKQRTEVLMVVLFIMIEEYCCHQCQMHEDDNWYKCCIIVSI